MQLVPVNLAKLHDRNVYDSALEIAVNIARAVESDTMSLKTPEKLTELAVLLMTTVQGCSCGYVIPAEGQMMQVQPALAQYNLARLRRLLGGWCQPAPRNEGTPWHNRHRLIIREQEDVTDQPVNPLASLIAGTVSRGTACFIPANQIDRSLHKAPRWKSSAPINLELPFAKPSAAAG